MRRLLLAVGAALALVVAVAPSAWCIREQSLLTDELVAGLQVGRVIIVAGIAFDVAGWQFGALCGGASAIGFGALGLIAKAWKRER